MAEPWEESEWLGAAERRVRAVANQVGLRVAGFIEGGWIVTLPGEPKMHFLGFLRAVTLWRADQMDFHLLGELMPMLKRDLRKLRESQVLIITMDELARLGTRAADEAVS